MSAADSLRHMAGLATSMALRVAVTLGLPERPVVQPLLLGIWPWN